MDASSLMHILMQIIIVGVVCWLLWWLSGFAGLPEPFSKIARILVAVVAVFFLINLMLGMSGGTPLVRWR